MDGGFIKLHHKMLQWGWYDDTNTKVLFIHCLLKANWKECEWHGHKISPGQFVTSLPRLAEETQMTVKQVRIALKHLKSSGEVADKGYSKYRIITVNNWDQYQADGRQGADKGQTEGRQRASIEEYKNKRKKDKAQNKFNNFESRTLNFEELEREAFEDST